MPTPLVRLSAVEYEASHNLVGTTAAALGVRPELVRDALRSAGERIAQILRLAENPISIESNSVKIGGIAGLLRVMPRFELEIIPKFLDRTSARWREDFFYLSMLSHHGRLLSSERLASSPGSRDDLATLVGRALVGMFWDHHRRPLRTYRRSRTADFSIDGDVDAEALVLPTTDGYEQELVAYDRRNIFNATILAAVQTLMKEVRDPQTRQQLDRVAQVLAPQGRRRSAGPRLVPNRSKRWQSLYDLATDVINGFGITFNPSWARSPGFILDTWRVWEDVIALGLRLGLGATRVRPQQAHKLGMRELPHSQQDGQKRKVMTIAPDNTIRSNGEIALLVDAKYKTRISVGRTRIASTDVYESLAFSTATDCKQIILAYPTPSNSPKAGEPGATRVFERVIIQDLTIMGVHVEIQGISCTGGLCRFAQNLTRDIATIG